MSWDLGSNGNSNKAKAEFTKFPVGITRIRLIDQSPEMRWTHWMNQHKRSVNCPGKGCPICEIRRQQKANKENYTYAMGRRYAINIFNLDTGKVEIMEQGVGFFEDLKDLVEDEIIKKGKKISDAIFKVKRKGTTKDDTSYRIDLDGFEPLDEVKLAEFKEEVTNLKEYFTPNTPEQILRLVSGEKWEDVMKSDNTANDTNNETDEDIEIS